MSETSTKPAPALSIETSPLTLAELIAGKAQLSASGLLEHLYDGRAHVRANALLGLAALGHGGAEYLALLRDGDARVARAAAEALVQVAATQINHVGAIADKLDGVRPEVAETIARMFAMLIGKADRQLIDALDTSKLPPVAAIIDACVEAGIRGLHLLVTAARDERTRVRINAMRGLGRLGDLDSQLALTAINGLERGDTVSDVRAAARSALGVLTDRLRNAQAAVRKSAPPPRSSVPELEERNLGSEQAAKAASQAPVAELVHALTDLRVHVRGNAIRILASKPSIDDATARALAVLLRDAEPALRAEAAGALGTLRAQVAAPALVAALGDPDEVAATAAQRALEQLGAAAADALVAGLDTPGDAHGTRIAALLGRLPDGPTLLRRALASTAVDVRIHAATGLGQLGARAGAESLAALGKVASGSNARLRAVATRAIERLAPRPDVAPPKLAIDGFEERVLAEAQLAAAKAALVAAGATGLAAHLHDVRPQVRANAAAALGLVGAEPLLLAAALRDGDAEVRLAAARSLDQLGDAAVVAYARELVHLLADPDPRVVAQATKALGARAVDAALVEGLEQAPEAAVLALILARRHAPELLTDAWARPAARAAAARGFVQLGKARLGAARYLLEAARVDPSPIIRELARVTLRAIDGAPAAPQVPAVAGFETELLDGKALAGLAPTAIAPFLHDGRAVVRANAATALGAGAATGYQHDLAALLRDDDVRVRLAALAALDKLGDDVVIAVAPALVKMLADARIAEAITRVLAARKGKVEAALIAGLETDDEAHGMRIAELICALPNAQELLFMAFDGPAQNVTINAGLGIGLLGAKRAGEPGRLRLASGLTGPITRKHHAMKRALALFAR